MNKLTVTEKLWKLLAEGWFEQQEDQREAIAVEIMEITKLQGTITAEINLWNW